MIGALIHAKLKILLRDRISLALVFILPVVFFSIFAGIFGGGTGGGQGPRVTAIVVDEDPDRDIQGPGGQPQGGRRGHEGE